MKRLLLLGALLTTAGRSPLAAQVIEAGGLKLKLGGRAQTQFSTTNVSAQELIDEGFPQSSPIPAFNFEIRRLRVATELEFQKWLTGKIEMEFAMAQVHMREVWMNLGIFPEFQLRFGQFKKPFSLLQLTSSSKWPVIERSTRQRGLSTQLLTEDTRNILTVVNGSVVFSDEQSIFDTFVYDNFDLGAAALGTVGRFGYSVGIFNGPGSDMNDNTNGKSIAGRATWLASTKLPLIFGAGFSSREVLVTMTPNIVTRDGIAYEADFELGEFRKPGLHIIAEAGIGRNVAIADTMPGRNFFAGQWITAVFTPVTGHRIEGWEVAGRVGYGNPRRGIIGDEAWLLTPGFNIYFSGRNRLMLNLDVYAPTGADFTTGYVVRSQAQIYY